MKDVPAELQKEVETWFAFVAGIDETYDSAEMRRKAVSARAFHVLGEFEEDDYTEISDAFLAGDATGSFAFLGRDADEQAPIIEMLEENGHEIVLHGNRHIGWGEFDYDEAHEYLARGFDALVDATGIEPRGFFAPLKSVSDGTVRAADELGIEWILGETDATVPDSLTLVNTVYPHDNRLLERGTPPDETFEQFREQAQEGETFLFHPNMLAYHDAIGEFEAWVSDVQPVSVEKQLETGGIGVVLDCVRPFKAV